MIQSYVTIVCLPDPDALEVRPRNEDCILSEHSFFLRTEACGLIYEICGRCGAVSIKERH